MFDLMHIGTLLGSEDSGPYVCQAKLIFDGLGADELFAGIMDCSESIDYLLTYYKKDTEDTGLHSEEEVGKHFRVN